MDIGIGHPWACILMCHDVDQDVLHLVAEARMSDAPIGVHVATMRQIETRIFGRHMDFPVAWPHDGGTRDRSSGEAIIKSYKHFGLRTMAEHATHANTKGGATSLEAGIHEINTREQHGRFKVSRSCVFYLEERRVYHRKDGEPVPLKDDALAAGRYALMMKRYFKPLDQCAGAAGYTNWPTSSRYRGDGVAELANGIEFPLFG
jgi:hypothetical protein